MGFRLWPVCGGQSQPPQGRSRRARCRTAIRTSRDASSPLPPERVSVRAWAAFEARHRSEAERREASFPLSPSSVTHLKTGAPP